MMEKKISIQWHDPQGMSFWLRGVKPDGSFYGELMYAYGDPARRAGTTVEGRIPPEDWAICQALIGQCTKSDTRRSTRWAGQLASWDNSIATPTILLQYEVGDEQGSSCAQAFLELKTIVEKHLVGQKTALIEFSKRTHNQQIHPIAGKPGSG